jgi:hypothetical protein
MAYFEAIANRAFQKNPEGKLLFFPFGIWPKGYVIDSAEQAVKLKISYLRFVRINFFLCLFLAILINAIIHAGNNTVSATSFVAYSAIVFIIYLIFIFLYLRHLTKGLNRTTEKLSLLKVYQSTASDMNYMVLIFLIIFSYSFFALSLYLLLSWQIPLISLLALILMGYGATASTYMLFFKFKHSK